MENPTSWERIDGRREFEGRVFDVWRDRIRIERGGEARESVFEVVRHPGAVAVVALHEDGAVALLRQFRYAADGVIWEIPAGTLEAEESFEACAERELVEEIGFRAARWTPLATLFTTPGFCDERMRIFLAEDLVEAEVAPEEDELLEVVRVPLAEALGRAERGEIPDAKTMVGLFLARARLESEGRWPLPPA